MDDKGTQPCTSMFSNGAEYAWFIEMNCMMGCKRLRNGQCRILHRLEEARFDGDRFPYEDLLDFVSGYGGKRCKRYLKKAAKRARIIRPTSGQIGMEEINDAEQIP